MKSTSTGKCLGLIISNDLSWRDQVDKVVKSCNSKQSGLWKCTHLLRQDQRKAKAEGVLLSRLGYCLEVVSQGRKTDLERLQSVQSKAARWVLQIRKQDWSLRGGLRKLGWLSMAQQAAYNSIKLAMKVTKDCKPERLYSILTENKEGVQKQRIVKEKEFKKLKATTRKSWSNRSLRWLEQMPQHLKHKDITLKSTKKELKVWVKHHIPVRGDRILWGKPLSGDMRRKKKNNEETDGGDDQEGAESQEVVANRNEGGVEQLDNVEVVGPVVNKVVGPVENRVEQTKTRGSKEANKIKLRLWKILLIAVLLTSIHTKTRLELKNSNKRGTGRSCRRRDEVSPPEGFFGCGYHKTETRTGVG